MLLRGRVSYSQIGGGIEAGLLLWFGAVHERCEDDMTLVRNLYEKRLASTFWSHNLNAWPGPIVRFFLESIGEEELLNRATSPRNLCEAHFALATRCPRKAPPCGIPETPATRSNARRVVGNTPSLAFFSREARGREIAIEVL
jgi:hypothetical protein